MKNLIIIICLLCAINISAQSIDVKNNGESVSIELKGTYIIERDTSGSGVISLRFIPAEQIALELESKLNGFLGALDLLLAQRSDIDIRLKYLNASIEETTKLIGALKNGN